MNITEFTEEQAKNLVQGEGAAWAFVPPPIPLDIPLSRTLILKDGDARGAVGELVGEARRLEASLLVAPLRRREAVLSNIIEGTYTQVEDVLLGEATAEAVGAGEETTEVLRTIEAIEIGQKWFDEGRLLSTSMILELHAALLRYARGERRNPGAFRKTQVYLGSQGGSIESARYVPPPWEQVRPLVDDLIQFASAPTYGPLIDAALMHYQFEAIHPFEDGNGRLGRALIPLFLLGRGTLEKPILYLGAYFAAHRDTYIDLLANISKRGEWVPWIEFFLDGVISEAKDADQRLQRIDALVTKYRAAAAAVSRSTAPLLVLDYVIDRVYVSVSDVAKQIATSVPTARKAIGVLEAAEVLRPGPRLSGKQYWVAQEVIDELYEI